MARFAPGWDRALLEVILAIGLTDFFAPDHPPIRADCRYGEGRPPQEARDSDWRTRGFGRRVVSCALYTVFQMAEMAVPRELFHRILDLIDGLRPRSVTLC